MANGRSLLQRASHCADLLLCIELDSLAVPASCCMYYLALSLSLSLFLCMTAARLSVCLPVPRYRRKFILNAAFSLCFSLTLLVFLSPTFSLPPSLFSLLSFLFSLLANTFRAAEIHGSRARLMIQLKPQR